jgi:hypothetical protein
VAVQGPERGLVALVEGDVALQLVEHGLGHPPYIGALGRRVNLSGAPARSWPPPAGDQPCGCRSPNDSVGAPR